ICVFSEACFTVSRRSLATTLFWREPVTTKPVVTWLPSWRTSEFRCFLIGMVTPCVARQQIACGLPRKQLNQPDQDHSVVQDRTDKRNVRSAFPHWRRGCFRWKKPDLRITLVHDRRTISGSIAASRTEPSEDISQ